jgi:hypothetical protein
MIAPERTYPYLGRSIPSQFTTVPPQNQKFANYGVSRSSALTSNIAQLKIAKAFWLLTHAAIKTGIQDYSST